MFHRAILAAACAVWAATATAAQAGDPPAMRAGFAERDITPELGMEVPGGYGKSFARSVHDPCKVRAAVFDDGQSRVALVGVDAGFVYRPMVLECRRQIQQRCGIRPEAVLIGASHSHSSGPLGIVQPGQYDHASELVRRLAYEKSACADPRYVVLVRDQVVAAVVSANLALAEARCGAGAGREDQVAYNRPPADEERHDLHAPGPEQSRRGRLCRPDGTRPSAWWERGTARGKLLGVVVNFACHATTSPGGLSANYIYYLERVIRGALGAEAIVVFLQGDSGDVTQVDNLSPYAFPPGERWAQIVGGRLGAEAVKTLLSMEPGRLAPICARSRMLELDRRTPNPERVKKCLELVQKDPRQVGATEWAFAKEIVLLDAVCAKWPKAQVEVQAIQLGPVVFLTNPGELFCQYRLDVKGRSRFPLTFGVSYANDFAGYVPTEEAFGPHGGGYETRLTSCTNLEPRAGRKIAEAELELAGQLSPGSVPRPRQVPPFPRGKPTPALPPQLD